MLVIGKIKGEKMGNIRFTKDQQKVIDTHECNLLVSAAAGSGKTAVLVERIIRMILDERNPITIDELLVVTFTNAAATEMRERIGEALYKAIERDPNNERLQDQLTLLPMATIMTLHAFCLQVIRNYFYMIDLDPSFTIGDETELALVRQEILEDVLEEFYCEGDIEFIELIEAYGPGKSDLAIEGLILNIYRLSMSHPEPMKWLNESVDKLAIASIDEWLESDYVRYMIDDIKEKLGGAMDKLIQRGYSLCMEDSGLDKMSETIKAHEDLVVRLQNSESDSELFDHVKGGIELQRAKSAKRGGTDPGLVEPVKAILVSLKDGLNNLKKQYGFSLDETLIKHILISHGHMETLLKVVDRFKSAYDLEKSNRNVIDFNDIEHFALKILNDETVATSYQKQFVEIMVDEYQDSNLVQESLVNYVSRVKDGQPNIFMVGDMKQSIYKFRLAKPELFAHKYDTYNFDEGQYQKKLNCTRILGLELKSLISLTTYSSKSCQSI